MKILTVTHAFGDYGRGDRITDPAQIETVLGSENAHHVVASEVEDPAPAKAKPAPDTTA